MKRKLNCILLVDDDPDDIVYHKIIINAIDCAEKIHDVPNGIEALKYLRAQKLTPPELIFLDINMPRMNGWEFLEEYKNLDEKEKARIVILLLSTSANPSDVEKAKHIQEVSGFETKPLTKNSLSEILQEHFKDYF